MTECPHCHQQIEINEINHGTLFSCPLCNAVYFVGWDGQPELPPTAEEMEAENPTFQDSAPTELPPDPPFENPDLAAETEMAFMPIETSTQDTIIDNSTYQNQDYESLPGEADVTAESENFQEGAWQNSAPSEPAMPEVSAEAEPAAEYGGDVPAEASGENSESPYDFNQVLGEGAPEPEIGSADQPGFQEVTDFANADVSVGPLTYTLKIEGIDSGRIYGELKEALTDSRFGWDVQELVKGIQNGTLELPGLNPAKAFVVVSRLKYLALRISWRQDVFTAP